jgi:hypothetical protein
VTRVYRLDIDYPEGSRDITPGDTAAGWQPAEWDAAVGPFAAYWAHEEDRGDPPFRWPSERLFLSRSGAARRAALLRLCGCTVGVVASYPVAWNEAGEPEKISDADGRQILDAVAAHPRRELVRGLAQAGSDVDDETGGGAGMWWHLSRALAVVDAMPDLRLDAP